MEEYIYSGQKKLRCGYTTGTCSAAAAGAAAAFFLSGEKPACAQARLPGGKEVCLEIADAGRNAEAAFCGVIKDGGDDPDVTSGMEIFAHVSPLPEEPAGTIIIDGGEGVGRVTKPGLDQPVGAAAINSVPRRMITDAVRKAAESFGWERGLKVVISIPGGRQRAAKTFNPLLGIEGGLSVLGTTGIVRPMSMKALIDTIRVQIRQKLAQDPDKILILTPGNYGLEFLKDHYGIAADEAVRISNFVGDSIDIAVSEGARGVLLAGHIGKMVKIAGGIMNTHSHSADARMEILAACALRAGADAVTCRRILDCVTTEAALDVMEAGGKGLRKAVMRQMLSRILFYLRRRAGEKLRVETAVISSEYGLLAMSEGFGQLMNEKGR